MTAPSAYRGSELNRAQSALVPSAGDLVLSDEGNLMIGDGATPLPDLRRVGEQFIGANPISNITKAKTGPYKVMLLGTSKQSFDLSPIRVVAAHLQTLFGDSGYLQFNAADGLAQTANGWQLQRYGGPFQYRYKATSSSSAYSTYFYGDTISVEFSRETDSVAANIQIDGSTVGTTPAAGAQAYSVRQDFTVTAGPHVLTIQPPASGAVYWEWAGGGMSTRAGVEVRNATLGGACLVSHVNVANPVAGEATPIAITGDNGINALFNRTDIDLFMMGFFVNDAGLSSTNMGNWSTWKTAMDKAATITAANGAKLLLMVETAGHYVMPNDGGDPWRHRQYMAMADYLRQLARRWNHITTIDHHAATAPPSYSQSDIAAYAARYFPNCSSVNVAAGTYTGTDFIHEDGPSSGPASQIGTALICRAMSIQPPTRVLASYIASDRARTLISTKSGQDYKYTLAGAVKRVPVANGAALQALANGTTTAFQGSQVGYVRDGNAVNLLSAVQTAVDASVTSDTYGTYLTMSSYAMSMGSLITGVRRMLTVRARGTISVRTDGSLTSFYASQSGSAMPNNYSSTAAELRYVVADSEPIVVGVLIGASGNSGNVYLSGDVFEVTLCDADAPVLVKRTSPTGLTAATSVVTSGYLSMPSLAGTLSTATLNTAGDGHAVPFIGDTSGVMTGLQIMLSGSPSLAGAVIRLCVHASDGAARRPSTLLLDGGTVDISAGGTTNKILTFGTPLNYTAGTLVWLEAIMQGNTGAILRALSGSSPLVVNAVSGFSGISGSYPGYRRQGVTAAAPGTYGSTYLTSSVAGIIIMPQWQ